MKRLILMRHGKSSWDSPVSDTDRALQIRGIKDAQLVATEFQKSKTIVDAAFSSPANRALHTGIIALRILHFPFTNFQVTNDLYDFSGNSVMQFIKNLNDKITSVIIFGHNHAFTEIANTLGDLHIENIPTAGLVQISFNTNTWKEISRGKTEKMLFPKQIKNTK